MMVRNARFADIPRLAELIGEMYERSVYRKRPVSVDLREAKSLLMNAIQRQGHKSRTATCVMVAEHAGKLTGFIVGIQEPVYHIGDRNMATDLFFYNSPDGKAGHAGMLLEAFLEWAEECSHVVEVRVGATDVIGDYQRTGRLYERHGLRQCGAIFERVIDRGEPQTEAAA